MRITVIVFSIISIVLGFFAVIGTFSSETVEDAGYTAVGGLLFLTQGILSLIYAVQTKPIPSSGPKPE